MNDGYRETYFSQNVLTDWLNCLKTFEIIFIVKTDPQWRAHLRRQIQLMLTEKLQQRTDLNNREFFRIQHTKLCMTLPFLRSIVVRFHQVNERPHNASRTAETVWLRTASASSLQSKSALIH